MTNLHIPQSQRVTGPFLITARVFRVSISPERVSAVRSHLIVSRKTIYKDRYTQSYTLYITTTAPTIKIQDKRLSERHPFPPHRASMSPFHPTKRDLLIVLVVTTVLGLLLQFDTIRLTESGGGLSSLNGVGSHDGSGVWDDRERVKGGDSWLESVETGARYAAMEKIAGMGQNKVKWGEGGAMETEVLAHAPGTFLLLGWQVRQCCANLSGWTIFDQIYLFNGTWYIVSDRPHKIPLLRLMTSTGNEIWNDEESTAGR